LALPTSDSRVRGLLTAPPLPLLQAAARAVARHLPLMRESLPRARAVQGPTSWRSCSAATRRLRQEYHCRRQASPVEMLSQAPLGGSPRTTSLPHQRSAQRLSTPRRWVVAPRGLVRARPRPRQPRRLPIGPSAHTWDRRWTVLRQPSSPGPAQVRPCFGGPPRRAASTRATWGPRHSRQVTTRALMGTAAVATAAVHRQARREVSCTCRSLPRRASPLLRRPCSHTARGPQRALGLSLDCKSLRCTFPWRQHQVPE
jgi:hypothetical protein